MSDGGEPSEFDIALAKTPAPDTALPVEVELIEALREAGCIIPDGMAVIAAIEPILDRIGDQRAADALGVVISRLKGKKGEEIRLALIGATDASLSQTAAKHGITKQTLFTNIQRLRRRIFGKTSDGAATCES